MKHRILPNWSTFKHGRSGTTLGWTDQVVRGNFRGQKQKTQETTCSRACTRATARNHTQSQSEDARRGYQERFVCLAACPATGEHERADSIRTACVEISRSQQCHSTARVPRYHHRTTDVCRQRMVRSHHSIWSPAHQLADRPRSSLQILCRSISSRERKFLAVKVPPIELLFPGAKVP